MHGSIKFLVSLCLLLLTHSVSFGQVLPDQPAKRKTKVHTLFDSSKNRTTAIIGPFELWKPPHNPVSGDLNFEELSLIVSFSYPDKKVVTPKTVELAIDSSSHGRELFKKHRQLVLELDSQHFAWGEMELIGSNSHYVQTRVSPPLTGAQVFYERLKKEISLEQFLLIANSKKAQMKLGGRKYPLNKDHLEAFRNFVLLMRQEGLEF